MAKPISIPSFYRLQLIHDAAAIARLTDADDEPQLVGRAA